MNIRNYMTSAMEQHAWKALLMIGAMMIRINMMMNMRKDLSVTKNPRMEEGDRTPNHINLDKTNGAHILYEPSEHREIGPYEKLSIAIIVQAAEDYAASMRMTPPGKAHRIKRMHRRDLREDCEKFFDGAWFDTLTNIPAEIVKRGAYTAKAIYQINDFLPELMASREKQWKKKKEVNFEWRKAKKKITDRRHVEYLERRKRHD